MRAQMCLAAAPPRQTGRLRSEVRTDVRSLSAPAAGSERPLASAHNIGGVAGRPIPAEGVRTDYGPAARGRLSPLTHCDLRFDSAGNVLGKGELLKASARSIGKLREDEIAERSSFQ